MGTTIELEVADDGYGIPKENLSRIGEGARFNITLPLQAPIRIEDETGD